MNLIKKTALILSIIGSTFLSEKTLSQEGGLEKIFQKETVTHQSGNKWCWKALQGNDYVPMTYEIFKELETNTSNIISGGFYSDPKIVSQSGTYTNTTSAEKIRNLINKFEKNISPNKKIFSALENLLEDKSSYIVIEQFFKDGGKIEAWPSSGRYNQKPLIISIGTEGNLLDIEKTIYHETLHYVFDKKNSTLFESRDSGGADHFAIFPLQERLKIFQQIRNNQIPIHDEYNKGLYGFTTEGRVGEKIKKYVDQNNLEDLKEYINSEEFQRNYVRSSMVSLLSSNETSKNQRIFSIKLSNNKTLRFKENNSTHSTTFRETDFGNSGIYIDVETKDIRNFDIEKIKKYVDEKDTEKAEKFIEKHQKDINKNKDYVFTKNQITDIAFLNAMNGAIIQTSINIGIDVARANSTTIEEAFKTPQFRNKFQEFMNQYTQKIENENIQPFIGAKKIY